MLDSLFLTSTRRSDHLATSPMAQAAAFFSTHGEALATVAELLGGPRWFGRWCRLSGNIHHGRLTVAQLRRELGAFLALLAQEHLWDPEGEETACAAMLHPDSPEVHQIRCLTETMERLLADMNEAAAASRTASGAAGELLVPRPRPYYAPPHHPPRAPNQSRPVVRRTAQAAP